MDNRERVHTAIIGCGAAGLQCAAHLGPQRGRGALGPTLLIDHKTKPAEKIRISGGGRCNFTNLDIRPNRFLSENPHFCKSALKRYSQWDFISQVADHGIAYHEKTLGQLFCDHSAQDIISMLTDNARAAGVRFSLGTKVCKVSKVADGDGGGFMLDLAQSEQARRVHCQNLVIATGGLSVPKTGASALGYNIANQFGHRVVPTRAGLVPLTFSGAALDQAKALSGVSTPSVVALPNTKGPSFDDGMLFTHRGLSGPSILQISSYWRAHQSIVVDLVPRQDLARCLIRWRDSAPKKLVRTVLAQYLPARLADAICAEMSILGSLADTSNKSLTALGQRVNRWQVLPSGSEGYRTAEVTLGGVDTSQLSSKTMESALVPGLYFIGEVVDVTGWLGGYNFQWAWSSGWAAAQAISATL